MARVSKLLAKSGREVGSRPGELLNRNKRF